MRRGNCFRCGRYGHFARECFNRSGYSSGTSPFAGCGSAASPFATASVPPASSNTASPPAAPKRPPPETETWTVPAGSKEDEKRNEDEIRRLLLFLSKKCARLVKFILAKFGEYQTKEDLPSEDEMMSFPLRGKLKELNEIYLQMGHRAEVVFSEADGTLCRVDLLNPEGTFDPQYDGHRCGEVEMELFKDETVFPPEWWLAPGSRFGLPTTLHRISGIAGRTHNLVGVVVRVGRTIGGVVERMLPPSLVNTNASILIIGPPNSGKTTVLREMARIRSASRGSVVVVVDKTCEIAGAADQPHASIGSARWQPVDTPENQHLCMRLAVENMSPSTVIVDEISTEHETEAARTISQRGVQLVATVHGKSIAELINDKDRSGLLGGVTSVTLARTEVREDGKKQVMMRKYTPLFSIVLELRSRDEWYVHQNVAETVDAYLRRESFPVLRTVPGKSEAVTAVPTEDGFEYDPPLVGHEVKNKTPFNFDGRKVYLPDKFSKGTGDGGNMFGTVPTTSQFPGMFTFSAQQGKQQAESKAAQPSSTYSFPETAPPPFLPDSGLSFSLESSA